MKKVFVGVLVILLLAGCGENTSKEKSTTDEVFKEELVAVSKIGDSKGKNLSDEIIIEDIKLVFNEIFDLAIFESHEEKFGEIVQGAGSDGKGGRIFCCKLPVDVKFVGTKASVERFVEYFEEIDRVVSFGDFKVEALDDERFEVTTLINFLGKAAGGALTEGTSQYTIKKNEIEVVEEEEVKFRDFDVSMIIRPSNSDSSAVSLGIKSDKEYRLYSSDNDKKNVKLVFSNEGSNYYCEAIIDSQSKKTQIKPSGEIFVDILSCDIEEANDEITVDLDITNNSNKKASVNIYEDNDGRVKVIKKVGSVEVNNK